MIQVLAKLAFLVVSAALHVAAFSLLPEAAQKSGGQNGSAGVTIQNAGASATEMVAEWEAQPNVKAPDTRLETPATDALALAAPDSVDVAPKRVRPDHLTSSVSDKAPLEPILLDAAPVAVVARVETLAAPSFQDVEPTMQIPIAPQITGARPESLLQPQSDKAPALPPSRSTVLASIRPKARPAQPQIVLRARGTGEAPIEGTTAPRGASDGLSATQLRALQAEWASAITRRIQRAQDQRSRRLEDGRVLISMVISRNGALEQVRVARSSGSPALDQAALATVRRAAPFPAAPKGLDDPRYPASQWIAFRRR